MRSLHVAVVLTVALSTLGCRGISFVRTAKEPPRPMKHPSEVAVISEPPVDRAYRDVGVFVYNIARWESDASVTDKLRKVGAEEGCDAVLVVAGDPNSPSCLYYEAPAPSAPSPERARAPEPPPSPSPSAN